MRKLAIAALLVSACVPEESGLIARPPDLGEPPEEVVEDPQCVPSGFATVRPILKEKCGLCHGDTPTYGAPMSLTKYSALLAPSYSDPTRPVHDLLIERLRGEGGRPMMPPPPNAPVSEDELMRIGAWSRGGAPEGKACSEEMKEDPPPAPPEDPLDPPVDPPAMEDPPPVEEPALEKIAVVAPGAAIRANMLDEYGCFSVKLDLPVTMHGVVARPVITTPEAVHHILLFRDRSRTYPEEKFGLGCSADTVTNSDWELIHGWAPGGGDLELPAEAGIRLETGDQFVIQVHYNNPSQNTYVDRSGMEIMATRTLRPNDATVVGIGPELFFLPAGRTETSRSAECTLTQDMHVYGVNPHMHLLGSGAKLELIRDGQTSILFERHDFTFETQQSYPLVLDLVAGDVLRATCYWDTSSRSSAVWFGERTEDEMCYIFTAHYPPFGKYSCN